MEVNQQEKEWLAALKAGDKSAFKAIYNQYYKYLVVTAFNVLGDSDAARDLAQDVFVEIWKKRETLLISSSLKPYLRRAVVNKTLNYIKASRIDFNDPANLPENVTDAPSHDEQLHADNLEKIIHDAIANLPERCRVVFTLCRLEKLSHKEIAAQLDISTKTVENQMTRALVILRKALGPYVGEELLILILLFF
ncbi:MAG: RNA polymerase sigma-70 factor [Saprospiraceae bacterium]